MRQLPKSIFPFFFKILVSVSQNVFIDKVLELTVLLFKFYVYTWKWQETATNFNAFL